MCLLREAIQYIIYELPQKYSAASNHILAITLSQRLLEKPLYGTNSEFANQAMSTIRTIRSPPRAS